MKKQEKEKKDEQSPTKGRKILQGSGKKTKIKFLLGYILFS